MPRNWTKLRNLGPHGIKADEIFGAIGEVVKNGGVLKTNGPTGEDNRELVPALPKGMQPANLKLRYMLYTLALSPSYNLGSETDPSARVAAKTLEICEEIVQIRPEYSVPRIYDERMRDAIIHLVSRRERDVLSETFEQAVIDPQNILRFLKENA
jgi:hypothetical protein